jgi:hypothetical protein
MTITEFCDRHQACDDGREWAIGTGCTTMAELWQREDMRPEWLEWIATRTGVLTDRELRLYACWCVRQVWHLLTDDRSKRAVEVAERHAMGLAGDAELAAAEAAAWAAARAAMAAREAREAARAAAEAAAWAAMAAREAMEAAWEAARVAARAAAGAARAAMAAAWAACDAVAAREAARAAAWAAQARYLLENVHPNFEARKAGL